MACFSLEPAVSKQRDQKANEKVAVEKTAVEKTAVERTAIDKHDSEAQLSKLTGPKDDVWVIRQNGKFAGSQTLYVSPDDLRIEYSRMGCALLVRSSDTRLYIVNHKKKLIYRCSIPKWRSSLGKPDRFQTDCSKTGINWRVVDSKKLRGVQADEYVLGRVSGKNQQNAKKLPRDPQSRSYWLARSIPIAKSPAEVLCRTADAVSLGKVPLKVFAKGHEVDEPSLLVDTISCMQKKMPQAIFAIPEGYKKVRNEFEVFDALQQGDGASRIDGIVFESGTKADFDPIETILQRTSR